MKPKLKMFTTVNSVMSGLLWLLGILVLLLNVLRQWELWQGVGFTFLHYAPICLVVQILCLIAACKEKDKRHVVCNTVFLLLSAALVLFTLLVSVNYG